MRRDVTLGTVGFFVALLATGCAPSRQARPVESSIASRDLPTPPPPSIGRLLNGYLGLRLRMTGERVTVVVCDRNVDVAAVTASLTPLRDSGTLAAFRIDPTCQPSGTARPEPEPRASVLYIESLTTGSSESTLIARRYRADRPREWRELYRMVDWQSASLTIDRINTTVD